VSFQTPLAIIASIARQSITRINAQMSCGVSSRKRRFSPCAIGIVGLALAVVLWGTGYRLSLYHHHATSSVIPVAKLWIESRNASMATASRLKTKSHLIPCSQVFSAPIQRLPLYSRTLVCILCVCPRDVAYFSFLVPFRSPPVPRFFLA